MSAPAGWPERHDCALLTSKGHATKAAKDLIDYLGDTGEELLFFCIHDADAAGTVIFEALQEATRARPARRVKIINLGLEPEEAVAMGLHVENVNPGKKGRKPVGKYVSPQWAKWLQTHRTELNEMTTPQFIAWLDAKMKEHGNGKIIPSAAAMKEYLSECVRKLVEESHRERILREAGFSQQVQSTMERLQTTIQERTPELQQIVKAALSEIPMNQWRAPIEQVAAEIAVA